MRFRTKDLLVTFNPKIGQAAVHCTLQSTVCFSPTMFCKRFTKLPCIHHTCGFFSVDCRITKEGCGMFASCGGPGGSACDTTYICPASYWEIESIEDLVAVQGELREVLTHLESLEKRGLPSQFESRADAEAAEQALSEALEQVRAQKEQLK